MRVVYKGVLRLPPCVCAPDVTAENPIKDPTGDKRARHTLKNILLVFQWHEAFILVSFLLAWSSTLQGSSLGKKNRMGVDGKSPQESYKTRCVRVCTECVTVTCVRWWECVYMQCLYDRVRAGESVHVVNSCGLCRCGVACLAFGLHSKVSW